MKKKGLQTVWLMLVVAFLYLPILILAVYSFTKSTMIGSIRGFSVHNYVTLFTTKELTDMIIGTVFLALLVAVLSSILGTLGAIGIFYSSKKTRMGIELVNQIPVVNSDVVTGFSICVLLIVFAGIDKDTYIPLILPTIAAPAVVFFMKQYMDSSLPRDIIDAARIDGSGEFHTFNTVILPILKPAMAVQAIFSFVGAWNNYFIPALIINDAKWKTVPILVAQLRSADFLKFDMGKVYMMITIAILPVMIVYLLLSKYIVRGVALGSVKG